MAFDGVNLLPGLGEHTQLSQVLSAQVFLLGAGENTDIQVERLNFFGVSLQNSEKCVHTLVFIGNVGKYLVRDIRFHIFLWPK